MHLSVVIPIYNEEANLHLLYRRLTEVIRPMGLLYELIFVNDGSRDNSFPLVLELAAQHTEVKFLNLSRNFGHQIAVSAGLDASTGDAVVIIDADLQDPPELIVDLYQQMQQGYDVVYARRRTREGESAFKLVTARIYYRLLASITSVPIPVDTGDFRIISRRVVNVLKQMPEKNKYLRGQISWIGFKQTFVEYDRAQRAGGETGYTFKKMTRLALDGITSFSDLPLKMATWMGFAVSGFAFVVIVWTLYERFIAKDYVPGWASTMVSILFLGGIQLIAIGIIGEYISRISTNTRQRPLYIIADSNVTAPAEAQGMHTTAADNKPTAATQSASG